MCPMSPPPPRLSFALAMSLASVTATGSTSTLSQRLRASELAIGSYAHFLLQHRSDIIRALLQLAPIVSASRSGSKCVDWYALRAMHFGSSIRRSALFVRSLVSRSASTKSRTLKCNRANWLRMDLARNEREESCSQYERSFPLRISANGKICLRLRSGSLSLLASASALASTSAATSTSLPGEFDSEPNVYECVRYSSNTTLGRDKSLSNFRASERADDNNKAHATWHKSQVAKSLG